MSSRRRVFLARIERQKNRRLDRSASGDSDSDGEQQLSVEQPPVGECSPTDDARRHGRINRHRSLMLPRRAPPPSGAISQRPRMNSWCGLQGSFNPNCAIHGRRALIEAFARDKFIQVRYRISLFNGLDRLKYRTTIIDTFWLRISRMLKLKLAVYSFPQTLWLISSKLPSTNDSART